MSGEPVRKVSGYVTVTHEMLADSWYPVFPETQAEQDARARVGHKLAAESPANRSVFWPSDAPSWPRLRLFRWFPR